MDIHAHRADIHDFNAYADLVNRYSNAGDPNDLENNQRYQGQLMQLFGQRPMPGYVAENDTQYHTYQFPKSREGMDRFIGTVIEGLKDKGSQDFINSSRYGIPIVRTNQLHHSYRKVQFTRALMDQVSEEGPPRIVRASQSGGSITAKRYALGLYVEHGWYWSEQGQVHFARSLIQLANSIKMTIQLHTILQVANSKSRIYEYEVTNNMIPDIHDIRRIIQRKASTFARFQKYEDGANSAVMDAKQSLKLRGKNPNALWIPYGAKLWLSGTGSVPLDYNNATDSQIERSRRDPDNLQTFLDMAICEIEDFSYETIRGLPFNPFRGEAAFGQYVPFFGSDPSVINVQKYRSSDRNRQMFDYYRDRWVEITLQDCLNNCGVFDNPMDTSIDFGPGFHLGHVVADGGSTGPLGSLIRKAKPLTAMIGESERMVDLFGCEDGGDHYRKKRFVNVMGEIDRKYLPVDILRLMAEKILLNNENNLEKAKKSLAPYHFDGYFRKTDMNNEAVVKDVVDLLFSDVKGIQLLPVAYGVSMYPGKDVEEEIRAGMVSGSVRDALGNRFYGNQNDIVKTFPLSTNDPYGITRSVNTYSENIGDPKNIYNVIDSQGNEYPKMDSNILTQYLYMRAMLIEPRDDMVRKEAGFIVPTTTRLVKTAKYGVNSESHEHIEVQDVDMEIEVPTGHPMTSKTVNHDKPVFDAYDAKTGEDLWNSMNDSINRSLEGVNKSALDFHKKVGDKIVSKEMKLMYGKTMNGLLNKSVEDASDFLSSIQSTTGKTNAFSKLLKETHYNVADHQREPIPSFSYLPSSSAVSASTPAYVPKVQRSVPLGAPIKSIRTQHIPYRSEFEEDFIEHNTNYSVMPANNNLVATVGIFDTRAISNRMVNGARLIPLDKSYKPTNNHLDALLDNNNPSHDYEISNAQNNLKSFAIKFNDNIATGAPVRGRPGSSSIFNEKNFKEMEDDLISNISRLYPTFAIWVAMSGKAEEEKGVYFNNKEGTLNSFIINGPTFLQSSHDNQQKLEKALTVVNKLSEKVKETVPIKSLQDLRTFRDPVYEQEGFVQEYKTFMNQETVDTSLIIDNLATAVNGKRNERNYDHFAFKKAFESEVNKLEDKADHLAVREYIEIIESFCHLWIDICTNVFNVATDDNVNSYRYIRTVILNTLFKYSSDDRVVKMFRIVFAGVNVTVNGALNFNFTADGNESLNQYLNMLSLNYTPDRVNLGDRENIWGRVLTAGKIVKQTSPDDTVLKSLYHQIESYHAISDKLVGENNTSVLGVSNLTSTGFLKVAKKHNISIENIYTAVPTGSSSMYEEMHGSVRAVSLKLIDSVKGKMDTLKSVSSTSNHIVYNDRDILYAKRVLEVFNNITAGLRPILSTCVNQGEVELQLRLPRGITTVNNIRLLIQAVKNGSNIMRVGTAVAEVRIGDYLDNVEIIPENMIHNGVKGVNVGRLEGDSNKLAPGDFKRVIAAYDINTNLFDGFNIPSQEKRDRIISDFRLEQFIDSAKFDVNLDHLEPTISVLNGIYFPTTAHLGEDFTVGGAAHIRQLNQDLGILSNYIYKQVRTKSKTCSITAVNVVVQYLFVISSNLSENVKEYYRRKMYLTLEYIKKDKNFVSDKYSTSYSLNNGLYFLNDFKVNERYTDGSYEPPNRSTNRNRDLYAVEMLKLRTDGANADAARLRINSYDVVQIRTSYDNYVTFEELSESQFNKFMEGVQREAGMLTLTSRGKNVNMLSPDILEGCCLAVNMFSSIYKVNLNTVKMSEAVQNKVFLLSHALTEPQYKNITKGLIGIYIDLEVELNSTNLELGAQKIGYKLNENSLLESKTVGDLIDDLIFDSDTFCSNSSSSNIVYILQNNTRFYTDLLSCMKRVEKSGYKTDIDTRFSNSLYADIGKQVYKLMEEHREGGEIIIESGKRTRGSAVYMTKLLISSMFEFSKFSVELRKLLGKHAIFRKSFGGFSSKMNEYIDLYARGYNLNQQRDVRNDILSKEDMDYNNSILYLTGPSTTGFDDGNINFLGNRHWTSIPEVRSVFTDLSLIIQRKIAMFIGDISNENENVVRLKGILENILLYVKNIPVLPLFIKDYYTIMSITRRQEFVNKLRGEFYKTLFTKLFTKMGDIDPTDYRYSELEYYISYARHITNPKIRNIYLRLLFSKPSKGFLEHLLESNIPFPFSFIVFRHGIKALTVDGVLGDWTGDGGVGEYTVGNSNTMFQNDAIIKSYMLHYHNYQSCMIYNASNLYYMENLWMEGFISGHGCRFYTKQEMKKMHVDQFRLPNRASRPNPEAGSLLVCMTAYRDDSLEDIIDIRGRFPVEQANSDSPYHFITTRAFFDNTGFDRAPTGTAPGAPGIGDTNFVCITTDHMVFDTRTTQWQKVPGQCHIGDRHSPNMVKNCLSGPKNRNLGILQVPTDPVKLAAPIRV